MPRRKPPRRNRKLCTTTQGEVKVIFPTELDAKIEVANHPRFGTDDSRYYKCRFGNHYHISTQEQRTDR